ncbi:hypothetical protein DYBT9275_03834 [Dyadobacter sp. CECT 9275]|uniref:Right handed beta helix domain-containing protein n=2 Tax=Dyadobacter helix TaxID=2822344 RepID=A0A916N5R7_9BACT|nr:hypothetical protein DYBT9275_03834 [Dyadobacter sp. CECT 9275]
MVDPIKFTITSNSTSIGLDQEFELIITARYISLPNSVFVFEGSNSFRLKVITPDGFEQTGGNFRDFVGTELSASKPSESYTLRGKFTRPNEAGSFQLLRSHKAATNSSTFVQVATLSFNSYNGEQVNQKDAGARIMLNIPGYIPYLNIAQLRSGFADTARSVFITDEGKFGLFRYNSESTEADDASMTIVNGSRRYERVYNGVVNVEWFGVKGDGLTDNSANIQTLLNNARFPNIYFPKPKVSYRWKSIIMRSNKNILFEEGTLVEGMGTLANSEKMILMYQVKNITIKGINVTIKDNKANYTSGEHRHIFSLEGVTNVMIEGIAANDSGGDGYYIGIGAEQRYSENVRLTNISADNNRRQGMSIISGKNIVVTNPILTNTKGTNPAAGIDIEPNAADEILEDIRIINPVTRNNAGAGITINLQTFSNTNRVVNIHISNHTDDGSFYGMAFNTVTGSIAGSVLIDNPVWKNSIWNGLNVRNYSATACPIEIRSPNVINSNTIGNTSVYLGAAILIYRAANDVGAPNVGNVHIFNPKVQDNRTTKLITSAFVFQDLSEVGPVKNCSLIDPISLTGLDDGKYVAVFGDVAISDIYGKISKDLGPWHLLMTYSTYKSVIHNATATAPRSLTLLNVMSEFPEIRIEVRAAQEVKIIPDPANSIVPLAPELGKYISSNVVGSSIVLKKNTATSWFIKEMQGKWVAQP